MEFVARQEGRITDTVFLQIYPSVTPPHVWPSQGVHRGREQDLAARSIRAASPSLSEPWLAWCLFLKVDDDTALDIALVHAGEDVVDIFQSLG